MSRKKLIPVHSRSEILHFATDEEFAEFWDTHEVTEEYLEDAPCAGADTRAAGRSTRSLEGRARGGGTAAVRLGPAHSPAEAGLTSG